jgi:hypothetical protein
MDHIHMADSIGIGWRNESYLGGAFDHIRVAACVGILKPRGTARLYIQRLPSHSKFTFYIIAAKNTDINEPFTISWGDKGKALLKLQTCDDKTQKGIDIGSQLSKLARKARQTVVKRNDN